MIIQLFGRCEKFKFYADKYKYKQVNNVLEEVSAHFGHTASAGIV